MYLITYWRQKQNIYTVADLFESETLHLPLSSSQHQILPKEQFKKAAALKFENGIHVQV